MHSLKKNFICLYFLYFLYPSLFGSHEVPVRHLLTNFDFFQIFNLLVSKENIFRPPDTVIRFLLFFISILTLLFSFMLKSDNRNQVSNSMKNTITALSLLFFITILITENIYNIVALLLISLSIYYAIFYGKKSFNRYEVILLFSYLLIFMYPFYTSLFHQSSLSELDNYLRFLVVIPVYITLMIY